MAGLFFSVPLAPRFEAITRPLSERLTVIEFHWIPIDGIFLEKNIIHAGRFNCEFARTGSTSRFARELENYTASKQARVLFIVCCSRDRKTQSNEELAMVRRD